MDIFKHIFQLTDLPLESINVDDLILDAIKDRDNPIPLSQRALKVFTDDLAQITINQRLEIRTQILNATLSDLKRVYLGLESECYLNDSQLYYND